MELNEFSAKFKDLVKTYQLDISDKEALQFFKYMNLLLDWNNKINLTAITEPNEVILKHFVDSLTINKYIKENSKIVDVGTGAGFPGLPVAILRDDVRVLLEDSLNKRILFLDNVCDELELNNVKTRHGRAEEVAQDKEYREQFDYATSRAVASLNILLEYMLPFVKVGGYCICMKGSNISDEIKASKKALEVLGGVIEKIDEFQLPNSDITRNIILIKKIKNTPNKFPRKAGTPSKDPIQ